MKTFNNIIKLTQIRATQIFPSHLHINRCKLFRKLQKYSIIYNDVSLVKAKNKLLQKILPKMYNLIII